MPLAVTVTSSDLSRHSADVFRAADKGPVEISRRDGENLVLMRRSVMEGDALALALASDVVAASLGPVEVPFVARLQDRFPWMHFLTGDEREQFAVEIVSCARACAAAREFGPFVADLEAWRGTAAAKASGVTPDAELEWLDASSPVERP